MAAYPPGLGNDQQAMQATAAMRQEPWYQAMMKSWGLDPRGDANGNVKLNEEQRQALRYAAEQHGIGFNNKFDEVDENGQIIEGHHKLKKLAIGAAIGGLALTGLGAAGIGPLAGAMSGIGGAIGGAAKAGGSALAHALGVGGAAEGSALGTVTGALGAGSKVAQLLGLGKDIAGNVGAQSSALENQLANNRAIGAKIDQAGPASDAQAFRNAMRAGIVSRMDPNAAPITIGGHVQPQLVTPENIAYAKTLQQNLAARQAAGKTPTEFGVPDPTQEELDARKRAGTAATVGSALDTGSKLASIFGLGKKKSSVVSTQDLPWTPDPATSFYDTSDNGDQF